MFIDLLFINHKRMEITQMSTHRRKSVFIHREYYSAVKMNWITLPLKHTQILEIWMEIWESVKTKTLTFIKSPN